MSRLDSFIRRLNAQKALLENVAARLGDLEGPVLELVAVCPIALVSSVRDTSFTCCAPFVGSGMHFRSFNPDPETLLGAWLCGDVLHGCGCL